MGKKTSLTYVELPKKYLAACLKVLVDTSRVCYMEFMLKIMAFYFFEKIPFPFERNSCEVYYFQPYTPNIIFQNYFLKCQTYTSSII